MLLSSRVFSMMRRFSRWLNLVLLVALVLSAIPREGARAAPNPDMGTAVAPGALSLPLPLLLKTTLKADARSASAAPALSPPTTPLARPLAVGFHGGSNYGNSFVPAEGDLVMRGTARLDTSFHKVYDQLCLHRPNLTFAWNGGGPRSVRSLGRFGVCAAARAFEHGFRDTDHHTKNEDYRVLDRLSVSWYASTGAFTIDVRGVWEVLPDDPPPSFAGAWDFEEPLPSRASTLITYTHGAGGLPTHDEQGWPLNLAYNGCFDSANGWGEWDYGFYTGGTTNASFWAPRIGKNRPGAWILRNYSRVFQRLEGLEPDTEYGLSFYVYHPYVAGDAGRFDVIGRMVDGAPDRAYEYRDLMVTQDDAWEEVYVRARTDQEGRLYVGIEVGLSDADWLAIDDLTVWADPDGLIDPREGDCGAPNCDLLSDGPVDVDVSHRHLGLTSEGWPSPNPIIVTMTVDLDERDTPGLWRGGYLQLSVKNLYDGPTRVFAVPWNGESPGRFKLGREESVDVLRDGSFDYYDDAGAYHYLIPFRIFPPHGTHEQYLWQIMVQPSDAAKLEIKAELLYNEGYPVTDPPNLWDRACVQAPQAQIHPVVFVHGILGSMPPGDHVWAEHPPLNWNVLGRLSPTLDPFTRSYYPLLQNLEKMGYEWGKTLHAVTYDWRNDNSASGGYLASQLPGIIEAAEGTPYVWRDGRADIVVHSMGGLVTRAYIEDKTHQPYASDLNRAVFIASPHEGFAATYDTWEGMTWRDYLNEEVPWGADLSLMTELMDHILWPVLVAERYRPSSEELTLACPGLERQLPPWNPLYERVCYQEAVYAWSHAEGSRGVQSLPQMLPTQDLIAAYGRYLVDVNDPQVELPYEVNTWLADLNDDVGLLDGRLGDIFVVYGTGKRTVISYTVETPSQGYQGMWQYGAKIRDFKPAVGDNLIPIRSTNLKQVTGAPVIRDEHGYDEKDAGHKALVFKKETQRDIGGFLVGYRDEEGIVSIPFHTPYDSTLAPGNLVRVLFLASRLLPPYPPEDAEVAMTGSQLLTDPKGRHLGYNPASGQVISEIPGAYLMGDDDFGARFFMLTDPIEGNYTLTISGVATYTENYALSMHDLYLDGAGGVRARVLAGFTGTLTTGQIITSPLFVPSLGTVGQWRLDEVSGTLAYDSSGYGHHGRLVGGPTWASGRQGGALHFDGLDDHVWISDSAHLNVSDTLTLEAWVYPESTAGERVLLSRWGDNPGQRAYELTLDEGHLRGRLSGDGVNGVDLGASTLTVTAGRWHHVALVYNGTSAYYYVDGVGQETPVAPPVGGVFFGTSPLFLGRSTDTGSAAIPFEGLLDEVQVLDVARDDLAAWLQSGWPDGPG